MSTSLKILLLVATILPITYVVGSIGLDGWQFFCHPHQPAPEDTEFGLFVVLQFAAIIWTLLLLVWYVSFVNRTSTFTDSQKAMWSIFLVIGAVISMPIFWYLYIWRSQNPKPQESSEM